MKGLEKLSPLIRSFVEKGPVGCSIMVAKDGKVLFEDYAGVKDLESGTPVTSDTVFRIFSMTKVVTCTAALQLYEQGKFLLNDPLSDYLPEWKDHKIFVIDPNGDEHVEPAKRPILVKDLFCMSSGLTYGGEQSPTGRAIEAMLQSEKPQRVQDLSKALSKIPLAFEPGTQWHYGLSHDVLGALIEVLSGETFGDYLENHIFAPLGMTETGFRLKPGQRERLAGNYMMVEGGGYAPNTRTSDENYQENATMESGGGGLLSTLGDYTKFAQAMACGGALNGVRILGSQTIDLMRQDHLNLDQKKDFNWDYLAGYSYGLGVRTMVNPQAGGSNSPLGEFGWCGLLGTWVSIDPTNHLTAVYMQQLTPNLEGYHQARLRAVIYGAL